MNRLSLGQQQPSLLSPTTSSSPNIKLSKSPSPMQRSFSPIPNHLSSPTPKSASSTSSSNYFLGPSPTTHLSYETFASTSASNLSIRSFPTVRRRASSNDTTSNKVYITSLKYRVFL